MSELNKNSGVTFCAQARVDIKLIMSGAGKYYERIPCKQLTLMTIYIYGSMRLTLVLHRGRCENSRGFAPGGPWVRAPMRPRPGHTLFGDPVTHWVAEFGDPVAPWLPKAGV